MTVGSWKWSAIGSLLVGAPAVAFVSLRIADAYLPALPKRPIKAEVIGVGAPRSAKYSNTVSLLLTLRVSDGRHLSAASLVNVVVTDTAAVSPTPTIDPRAPVASGCNCSVPYGSSRTAWPAAASLGALAVLLFRGRRRRGTRP